jgi:DNA-directed RNA polymerase subunit RPC12/RpoP
MKCIKCKTDGGLAQVDVVIGYALIDNIRPDGTVEWSGKTDIDWNSQRSKRKPARYICLECSEEFTLEQLLKGSRE